MSTARTSIEVSVLNVGPTLSIAGDSDGDEGSTYTLNLSASDLADDAVTSWTIDWGDGNVEIFPGNPSSVTHIYADGLNHFDIFATATDEDGTYVANEMLVSAFNSDNVVRFAGGSGEFLGIFGEATNSESGLDGAIGMVFGPNGDLFVAAELSQNVHRFDGETGEFLGVFGNASFAASGLDDPIDLEFGPDGDLYVTSSLFHWDGISECGAVLRYDGVTGAFKGVFGQANALDSTLDVPVGMTFGPNGNLFVASQSSNEVLQYDGVTGAFLGVFGEASPSGSGLERPSDVVFDPNDDLFVSTRGQSRQVLHYDGITGDFLGRFGDAGPESGVVGPHTVLRCGVQRRDRRPPRLDF